MRLHHLHSAPAAITRIISDPRVVSIRLRLALILVTASHLGGVSAGS